MEKSAAVWNLWSLFLSFKFDALAVLRGTPSCQEIFWWPYLCSCESEAYQNNIFHGWKLRISLIWREKYAPSSFSHSPLAFPGGPSRPSGRYQFKSDSSLLEIPTWNQCLSEHEACLIGKQHQPRHMATLTKALLDIPGGKLFAIFLRNYENYENMVYEHTVRVQTKKSESVSEWRTDPQGSVLEMLSHLKTAWAMSRHCLFSGVGSCSPSCNPEKGWWEPISPDSTKGNRDSTDSFQKTILCAWDATKVLRMLTYNLQTLQDTELTCAASTKFEMIQCYFGL